MQTHERPVIEHYRFSVEWSAEDDEFVATVAEFPSLSWLEASQVKALEGLENLLREVVDDMLTRGEDVPLPFSGRRFSGNLKVRVSPEKHRQLVIFAHEQGVSLNRYLAERLT